MSGLRTATILIVEDERNVRMLMRIVLEAAGARVIEAEHGAAALRLIDLHPEVRLVCTDLWMPELDGIKLARHLRSCRPELPIVAVTAMEVATHVPDADELFDGTVHKPFVPAELVRTVLDVLAPQHPAVMSSA